MLSVLEEDLNYITNSEMIDWNKLNNNKILITGSTGLIGSLLVKSILLRNKEHNSNIIMYLPVRDKKIAQGKFGNDNKCINYIETSIEEFKYDIKVDYIIHGASPTKSKFFVENPVETLNTSILGTKNILEIARKNTIKSMVYLSSMEVYGVLNKDDVNENDLGYIDLLNLRSSYSEGKRIAELYCYSYNKEYNIPVKMCRIAQTFGPGISKNENRVYKYFIDSILNNKDIVLKSSGSTIINYSYTADTVLGILCVLINGKSGEAYNLVGDNTNMTILDSAKWLISEFGENTKILIDTNNNNEFAPENKMVLNNQKIKNIGWSNKYDIKEGYRRLIKYIREEL